MKINKSGINTVESDSQVVVAVVLAMNQMKKEEQCSVDRLLIARRLAFEQS